MRIVRGFSQTRFSGGGDLGNCPVVQSHHWQPSRAPFRGGDADHSSAGSRRFRSSVNMILAPFQGAINIVLGPGVSLAPVGASLYPRLLAVSPLGCPAGE